MFYETKKEFVTLNVGRFGASGDGNQDDALAIQTAIACCPKGGRVYLPAGRYRVTSLFFKNDLVLDIGKDAVLLGCTERKKLGILPGTIQS